MYIGLLSMLAVVAAALTFFDVVPSIHAITMLSPPMISVPLKLLTGPTIMSAGSVGRPSLLADVSNFITRVLTALNLGYPRPPVSRRFRRYQPSRSETIP